MTQRVLVVFDDRIEICWLRLLKPGFRHCFAVVDDRGVWVVYEARSNLTAVQTFDGDDPAGWYRGQGHTVVETRVRAPVPRAMPWAPFTCVEAVKRVIGLRAGAVWTPWQLYRTLSKEDEPWVDCSAHRSRRR